MTAYVSTWVAAPGSTSTSFARAGAPSSGSIGPPTSCDALRAGAGSWCRRTPPVFPTVALLWVSTDVDDVAAVLAEAARVLTPNGQLLCYGVHPCFNGPCIEPRDDGGTTVHPTYRAARWHDAAPWWGPDGLRRRIGMRHVPLAELLNAFLDAGLSIDRVFEPGDRPVPFALAIRARRRDGAAR